MTPHALCKGTGWGCGGWICVTEGQHRGTEAGMEVHLPPGAPGERLWASLEMLFSVPPFPAQPEGAGSGKLQETFNLKTIILFIYYSLL